MTKKDTTVDAFIVQGGKPLKGSVELSGAKNVALKVLIAALLFDEPVSFDTIPELKDVKELIGLIDEVGAKITYSNGHVTIDPTTLNTHEVGLLYGSKIRVSFLLFAPLLHKFKKAYIPNPGGCRIGARPIDRMIKLIEAYGVQSEYDSDTGYYDVSLASDAIHGTEFTFPITTHTGTELAIMMAVKAHGTSVINNAALEPEIDDLISFLNKAGAKIERKGSAIHVEGVKRLSLSQTYSIMHDRNNAVTYASFAYATKGDIFVKGADFNVLKHYLAFLDEVEAAYEVQEDGIRFYHEGLLKPAIITTSPEPGFMTDWQAPSSIILANADGESRIYETVFENRFGYANELKKMGLDIEFIDPSDRVSVDDYQFGIENPDDYDFTKQAVKIHGPTEFHGGVVDVTDMRAGATLLIAACAAQGESVINGASQIDRGYSHIEKNLTNLGANIRRV